ncbi:OmpA family protein [Mangrovimonas spongiae]|uniref:OmpA family protein n=1 Tax=Mangrovimonas spongiae TaxID=2494697 RepID=A0A428K5B4_9FLAO|nr:OmpA family protein [Mangrovimonas spongiae]RSK41597.1 OmpA family protein [Mangrovimonas spongiae]
MKYQLLTFFFLFQTILLSQNLVKNPSFEEFKNCPESIGYFSFDEDRGVRYWLRPTGGTPDYFNKCSKTVGYTNFNGQQNPRTGKGYAGFYGFTHDNYREYIQGTLSQTLEKDKTYQISFYVSLSEQSNRAIRHFGVYFLDRKMSNINYDRVINAHKVAARADNVAFAPIFNKNYLNNKTQWVQIQCSYKAKGFETYFLIGNFESNFKSDVEKIERNKFKPMAYYYIDDVAISLLREDTNELKIKVPVEKEHSFKKDKTYTFKNVLFDFDKATLLEASKNELNNLYEHLIKHPELHIEIYGHTDNVGTHKRNQELSEQRAKAVSDYLINKGLDKTKIKWFGYGSSKPKVKNNTEKNRAINRRVAFKLIEK